MNVIEKVFGTHSERELKRILPIVDKIESLRDDMTADRRYYPASGTYRRNENR